MGAWDSGAGEDPDDGSVPPESSVGTAGENVGLFGRNTTR